MKGSKFITLLKIKVKFEISAQIYFLITENFTTNVTPPPPQKEGILLTRHFSYYPPPLSSHMDGFSGVVGFRFG